jgi:hypothetical protein
MKGAEGDRSLPPDPFLLEVAGSRKNITQPFTWIRTNRQIKTTQAGILVSSEPKLGLLSQ